MYMTLLRNRPKNLYTPLQGRLWDTHKGPSLNALKFNILLKFCLYYNRIYICIKLCMSCVCNKYCSIILHKSTFCCSHQVQGSWVPDFVRKLQPYFVGFGFPLHKPFRTNLSEGSSGVFHHLVNWEGERVGGKEG